jgi:hypothetical protein
LPFFASRSFRSVHCGAADHPAGIPKKDNIQHGFNCDRVRVKRANPPATPARQFTCAAEAALSVLHGSQSARPPRGLPSAVQRAVSGARAATKFYVAGLSVRVIAEIMGWEEEHVEKIIRRYVGRTATIKATINQLNRSKGEQTLQNRLQNPQSDSG